MKKTMILVVAALIMLPTSQLLANSAPVVSNVTASQRGNGSKLVDIFYDLSDADADSCTVWIAVSDDDGATWDVPAFTVSGDVGDGVTPDPNKHIVWDAGHDIVGKVGDFKTRVHADDGNRGDMVLVEPGNFPYDGTDWVFVPGYYIDKYEVTNQRYCEFLNADDPDGLRWDSNMEILRQGTAGDYYYFVEPGRENYPIRYVSYYDAEACAQWLSTATGLNYRLPDRYEWQKAAAWDPVEQYFYTYGFHQDTIDCTWCNYDPAPECYGGPLPVGSFNGTGGKEDAQCYYGAYDMSGNIHEWTNDVYPNSSYRVLRGGCWSQDSSNCNVTTRDIAQLDDDYSYFGFRLALDLN